MSYRKTIKRDKTDAVLSELVRERVNWYCEYGGSSFCRHGSKNFKAEGDTARLHHSHLFGRGGKSTRYDPFNGFAHCHVCHQDLEENPPKFTEWAKKKLGERQYNRLMVLHYKPTKLSRFDKEVIHKHYLAERKRMRKLRDSGEMGRIEFTLP